MATAPIYIGSFYVPEGGGEIFPEQVREMIRGYRRAGWRIKLKLQKLDWEFIKEFYRKTFNRLAEIEGDSKAHERTLEELADEVDITDSVLMDLIPHPGGEGMLDNIKTILWIKKYNREGYREPLQDEYLYRDV